MLRPRPLCLFLLLTSCQQAAVSTPPAPSHPPLPEELALDLACPVVKSTFPAQAQEHKMFNIVGIGSSSMEGVGASAPKYNFLSRLNASLTDFLPGVAFDIINAGIGGQNLNQMLARFDKDVYSNKLDLVIFQTGMNDVIQNRDVETYRAELRSALEGLQTHGLQTVLMSNQYAGTTGPTSTLLNIKIDQINKEEARLRGVPVIDRYALFKSLQDQGVNIADTYFRSDLLHANDEGYRLITTCTLRRVFGLN